MEFILRSFQDGFQVLYNCLFKGQEISRSQALQTKDQLLFVLSNKDPNFLNYTQGAWKTKSDRCYFFSNHTESVIKQTSVLHMGKFAEMSDTTQISKSNSGVWEIPFGLISIQLHPRMEENFTISFTNAKVNWCYVLTRDYLISLNAPVIINKVTQQLFEGPESVQLPDGRQAMAFWSKQPIAWQESIPATYQLLESYDSTNKHGKIVLPFLPHPDIKHNSVIQSISAKIGKTFSYIII